MFGLDFIRKLKPCKWRCNKPLDDGRDHFGFIAQEVDEVAPKEQYGFVGCSKDGTHFLIMTEFIGPIVKAIQELEEKVKGLEKKGKG